MAADEILTLRLRLLRRRLEMLSAYGASVPVADAGWMREEFDLQAGRLRARVLEVEQDSRATWSACAVLEREASSLFTEALTWLQARGVVVIGASGAGGLARRLVAELAEGCGVAASPFVAPDPSDSFSDVVSIVRLRFPPADIWDVPIAAHEFGHFAASCLVGRPGGRTWRSQAFPDLLRQNQKVGELHLAEHWADAVATYAVGPAFAYSALLLRFDLSRPLERTDRHPSPAARAAVILSVLDRMGGEVSGAGAALAERWSTLTAPHGALEDGEREALERLAGDLFERLEASAGRARYTGYGRAIRGVLNCLISDAAVRPAAIGAADLLNAAWEAFLQAGLRDEQAIAARALRLLGSREGAGR